MTLLLATIFEALQDQGVYTELETRHDIIHLKHNDAHYKIEHYNGNIFMHCRGFSTMIPANHHELLVIITRRLSEVPDYYD